MRAVSCGTNMRSVSNPPPRGASTLWSRDNAIEFVDEHGPITNVVL